MDKKYNINEIFYSIQGEATNIGIPSIFIRFSVCNLACAWCDTDFHATNFSFTKEELVDYILNDLGINNTGEFSDRIMIVFTGGEPMLQLDTDLLRYMKDKLDDIRIAVESNGVLPYMGQIYHVGSIPYIDWLTLSPKPNIRACWEHCSELKIVLSDDANPSEQIRNTKGKVIGHFSKWIQPCSQNFKPAFDYVLNNPAWRLSVQVQKVLQVK